MALAHDVSHELRGRHGEWTKGGAALHRLVDEAKAEKAGGHKEGDRVKYKTGAMGVVHHIDDKGVPHVVWDKGRGKPVRTPAHHLTHATSPAAAEKAARDVTSSKEQVAKDYRKEKLAEIGHVPPYKPPRQAGSRGGVPAPTAGGIDPKLLAQVKEIQAKEKARMEAENKGRGGVTEHKDILTTPESAAYLAKLPGGGVQAGEAPITRYKGQLITSMSDRQLQAAARKPGSPSAIADEIKRRAKQETGSTSGQSSLPPTDIPVYRINGQRIKDMSDYQLLAAQRNLNVGEVGHLAASRKAISDEISRRKAEKEAQALKAASQPRRRYK